MFTIRPRKQSKPAIPPPVGLSMGLAGIKETLPVLPGCLFITSIFHSFSQPHLCCRGCRAALPAEPGNRNCQAQVSKAGAAGTVCGVDLCQNPERCSRSRTLHPSLPLPCTWSNPQSWGQGHGSTWTHHWKQEPCAELQAASPG